MADIDPAGTRSVNVAIVPDEDDGRPGYTTAPVLIDDDAGGLPRRATLLPDGSVKLAFREPVTIRYRAGADAPEKSEVYAELTFHRLKGADMRAIQAASAESRAVVAIARSARVREGLMHLLFDFMDGEDVSAAGDVVAHFLGNGRKTTGR